MKDDFRKMMHTEVGKGGLKCYCCNDYFGKHRKNLQRMARSRLKRNDRELIESGLQDYYDDPKVEEFYYNYYKEK